MKIFTLYLRAIRYILILILNLLSFTSFATINLQTGEFSINIREYTGMIRFYIGTQTHRGILGKKWLTVYDNTLKHRGDTNMLYLFDAVIDKTFKFERNADGGWLSKVGTLTETDSEYRWKYKERQYVFNKEGLLVEYHKDAYVWFKVEYDESNHISKLNTYEGKIYTFETNEKGMITHQRLEGVPAHKVFSDYTYKDDYLIKVVCEDGVNDYTYDDEHYLTYSSFVSKPPLRITYEKFDGVNHVSKVVYRDTYETYKYTMLSNTTSEKHFTVDIEKGSLIDKDAENKETGTNKRARRYSKVTYKRNEFNEVYEDGEYKFTQRIRRYRDKDNKFVFDQINASKHIIQSVKRRDGTKTFANNEKGKVIREETDRNVINLTYNDANKVTYYHYQSKELPEYETWTRYSYNTNNQLIDAENNKGQVMSIQHNSHGDISTVRTNKDTVDFTYNMQGKVTRISIQGVGAINVKYDIHGKQVSSKSELGSGESIGKKMYEISKSMTKLLNKQGVSLPF